jgi:hypothetical protein
MSENPPPRLDDWMRALGHILLNFGTRDYMVLVYLQKHLQPTEFSVIRPTNNYTLQRHFSSTFTRLGSRE